MFQDRVSLCTPGWPQKWSSYCFNLQTAEVTSISPGGEAGLKHTAVSDGGLTPAPPDSPYQVLGFPKHTAASLVASTLIRAGLHMVILHKPVLDLKESDYGDLKTGTLYDLNKAITSLISVFLSMKKL